MSYSGGGAVPPVGFVAETNINLATATSVNICMTTGSKILEVIGPLINTNSGNLSYQIFEDSDFSGGTTISAFNSDRTDPTVPSIAALVRDPTINDIGTPVSPLYTRTGSNNASDGLGIASELNTILKANTSYCLQITHNDGQNRDFNITVIVRGK